MQYGLKILLLLKWSFMTNSNSIESVRLNWFLQFMKRYKSFQKLNHSIMIWKSNHIITTKNAWDVFFFQNVSNLPWLCYIKNDFINQMRCHFFLPNCITCFNNDFVKRVVCFFRKESVRCNNNDWIIILDWFYLLLRKWFIIQTPWEMRISQR